MSGPQSTHRLLSAANTTNPTLVDAAARKLYSLDLVNAAVITYLKIYDKATAPDQNDIPRLTLHLAASQRFRAEWRDGLVLARGLGYRLVTGLADNDSTAVAAAAVLALNIDWS